MLRDAVVKNQVCSIQLDLAVKLCPAGYIAAGTYWSSLIFKEYSAPNPS